MAVPFAEKLTVPPGATGVKATPARVAVKVTDVFKADGLAGEGAGVRVIVGLSFVIVYGSAAAVVAVLKFASPE
jgi:hypothetical protein